MAGFGFLGLCLELAVDADVGILEEVAVGFESGSGLGVAFDDVEIMMEETEPPFEGFGGMGVLKGVGLALGFFDKFAVGHTGCGPFFREMEGIELEEAFVEAGMACDDTYLVLTAEFLFVQRAYIRVEAGTQVEVPHASIVASGWTFAAVIDARSRDVHKGRD